MSPRAAWRLESLGFREVLDYRAGKADWGAAGLPLEGGLSDVPRVGPLAATDVPTCRLDERVDGVRHRATAAGWGVAVVVSDSRVVLGILRRRALEGRPEARVDDVMAPGPSTFRPNVTAHELYHYLLDRGVNLALLTTSEGTLVGTVHREGLERALREAAQPRARSGGYVVKGW